MTNNRIGRIIQTLRSLETGQRNHVTDLMEVNKCSRRTVFRDLQELKKVGIEYDYDKDRKTYHLHDDQLTSPPSLNHKEALTLLLLAKKAKIRLPALFEKSARAATLKLENSLAPPVRKYCREVLSNITVNSEFQSKSESFDDLFFSILTALHKKRIVTFSYNLDGDIKCDIILNPYHLYYCGHRWYLMGKSHFHKKITHFQLNLIKNLECSGELFSEKNPLDIDEYLGDAWQRESDNSIYHVKLRFSANIAKDVAVVQWHRTQSVTKETDGSIIMEFKLSALEEITFWILGYGANVQVLSPEALRKTISETAINIASLYGVKS